MLTTTDTSGDSSAATTTGITAITNSNESDGPGECFTQDEITCVPGATKSTTTTMSVDEMKNDVAMADMTRVAETMTPITATVTTTVPDEDRDDGQEIAQHAQANLYNILERTQATLHLITHLTSLHAEGERKALAWDLERRALLDEIENRTEANRFFSHSVQEAREEAERLQQALILSQTSAIPKAVVEEREATLNQSLLHLQKLNATLNASLEQASLDLQAKATVCVSLTQQLTAAHAETTMQHQTLSSEKDQLNTTLIQLQAQFDAARANYENVLAQKDSLLAEKESSLAQKEQEIAILHVEVVQSTYRAQSAAVDKAVQEANAAKDLELTQAVKEAIATKDSELSDLKEQLMAHNFKFTNVNEQLSAKELEIVNLQQQLATKDSEVIDLQQQLASAQSALLSTQSSVQSDATDWQSKLDEASAQVLALESVISAERETAQQLRKDILGLQGQVTEFQANQGPLEQEHAAQKAELQSKIDAFTAEKVESEAHIHSLTASVEGMKVTIDTYSHTVEELSSAWAKNGTQVTELSSQLKEREDQVTGLNAQLSESRASVSTLQNQIQEMEERLTQSEAEGLQLRESQDAKHVLLNEEWTTQMTCVNDELSKKESELQSTLAELEVARLSWNELQERLTEVTQKSSNLEGEMILLRQQLSDIDPLSGQKISDLQAELSAALLSKAEVETSLSSLASQLDNERQELKAVRLRVSELTAQVDILTEETSRSQSKYDHVEELYKGALKDKGEVSVALAEAGHQLKLANLAKDDMIRERETADQFRLSCEMELDAVNGKLNTLHAEHSKVQVLCASLTRQVKTLTGDSESLSAANSKIHELELALQESEEKTKQSVSVIAEKEAQFETLQSTISSLKLRILDLEGQSTAQNATSQRDLDALRQELEHKTQNSDALVVELARAAGQAEALTSQILALEEVNRELSLGITKLRQEKNELEVILSNQEPMSQLVTSVGSASKMPEDVSHTPSSSASTRTSSAIDLIEESQENVASQDFGNKRTLPPVPESSPSMKRPRGSVGDASPATHSRPSSNSTRSAMTPASSIPPYAMQRLAAATPGTVRREREINSAKIVITFSGFKDGTPYSLELKTRLIAAVKKLPGAAILIGMVDDFDKRITHVIAPPKSRTLKTFAGSLAGAWLITDYKWVEESLKKGQWLPEADYGMKFDVTPFTGKRVYPAPSFLATDSASARPIRRKYLRVLVVECGGGQITDSLSNADFVIKADDDQSEFPVKTLDWNGFVGMIPQSDFFQYCGMSIRTMPIMYPVLVEFTGVERMDDDLFHENVENVASCAKATIIICHCACL